MASQILQNQNRNQERDRIVFLENIERDTALDLTKTYPNLMMFTNGYKLDDYNDNEEYKIDSKPIVGSHIIFNGIPYTIIQGVHPTKNTLNINGENISLWIDSNGLLRLSKVEIQERYFYIGPYNPLTDDYHGNTLLTEIEGESNKYQAHEKIDKITIQNLFTDHASHWDFVSNQTYGESHSVDVLLNGTSLSNNSFNDYYIGNKSVVYMIIPVDFINNIFISNTLQMGNNNTDDKFIPKLTLFKKDIKLDDECKYNIYTSESYTNYDYIRVYEATQGSKNMNLIGNN